MFKEYFSLFGVPSRIITDRGTTFTSSKFKEFLSEKSVKYVLNAVATPRANGQVERYNRTVLDSLTAMTFGKDERLWDEYLLQVQWGLNNTTNKAVGKTPAQLLFGLRLTGLTESRLALPVQEHGDTNISNIQDIRNEALDKIVRTQEKQKQIFDKARISPRQFEVGQLVRVEREVCQKGKSKKLVPKCLGPYRVTKVLQNDRYEVEDTPITKKKGKQKYVGMFSVDKIYPWLVYQSVYESNDDDNNNSDMDTNQL